jgi:TM2 domain-containing membrane protein YozV
MTQGPDTPDPSQPEGSGQPEGSVPPPYGQQPPSGEQPPYGQQAPYGQQPYGQPPYGQVPSGYPPPGGVPYGAGPGAPYGVHPVTGMPYSDKTKLVAGLLQIFLGGFGVGRFYLGDNKTAIWQIVVTVLTCGLGSIWGLVDGIIILATDNVTDAQGRPLRMS